MIDPTMFKQVLGHYPTGVCVVTSNDRDGRPVGMAVGSFTSVSLAPPLVAFFPDRRSATFERIRETQRFCVNVLSDHQEDVSQRFAGSGVDKFAGSVHRASDLGLPILSEVVAWIDCRLHAVHEAGDHFIVIGDVTSLAIENSVRPLIFHKGCYGRLNAFAAAA